MPTAPLVLAAALLGLAVGPFLDRVARRTSHPGDEDPGVSSRWRRPFVAVGTAALLAGVTALEGPTWFLPVLLHLAALAVVLTLADLRVHRLPDAVVLPAYPVSAALLVLASWNPGGVPAWGALGRAATGGAGLLVLYLVAALARPGGMGLGDVKLAGLLGLSLGWSGWDVLVVGAAAAFLLGAAHAVPLLVTGRAARGSELPFGPWMLAGAFVGFAVGGPVGGWYLGLLG